MGPLKLRTKFISVGIIVLLASFLARFTNPRLWWNKPSLNVHQGIATQDFKTTSSSAQSGHNADDATGLETGVYVAQVVDEELDSEDPDWELDNFEISWGSLENYELLTKLGEGEYAEVFKATDLQNNRSCVTKILKPVSMRAVKREIKILQDLSGGPNIVHLVDVATDSAKNLTTIVTEHVNNTYYRALYPTLNDIEVRFYMFQLLRALDYAHGKSIMHRDIKPHNIMIEHENQKLRLIDWGLSDYYDETYAYTTSVGSRFWRAPEVLVDFEWYNPSADMWAFGCMLAGLVFAIEPFFYGRHNNVNQLIKIAEVLGTEDLFNWLDKYEIQLPETFSNVTSWFERKRWSNFVDNHNQQRVSDDALDLLSKVLVYDHLERISANEALLHPYFDPVREEALAHVNSVTTWFQ